MSPIAAFYVRLPGIVPVVLGMGYFVMGVTEHILHYLWYEIHSGRIYQFFWFLLFHGGAESIVVGLAAFVLVKIFIKIHEPGDNSVQTISMRTVIEAVAFSYLSILVIFSLIARSDRFPSADLEVWRFSGGCIPSGQMTAYWRCGDKLFGINKVYDSTFGWDTVRVVIEPFPPKLKTLPALLECSKQHLTDSSNLVGPRPTVHFNLRNHEVWLWEPERLCTVSCGKTKWKTDDAELYARLVLLSDSLR